MYIYNRFIQYYIRSNVSNVNSQKYTGPHCVCLFFPTQTTSLSILLVVSLRKSCLICYFVTWNDNEKQYFDSEFRASRVEVPEVISAEQRCFIVLTFFSAD